MSKPIDLKYSMAEIAREHELYPKEEMVKTKEDTSSLCIGIPKEISFQENRIPLTPHAVSILTGKGNEVWLESGAGLPSKYSDNDFSEAGAKIVHSPMEIYKANIIVKVEPPELEELQYFKPGQILFSAIQTNVMKSEYIKLLLSKKINSIAYEYLKDDSNIIPIVRSMSEITGSSVMLIAAELLSSINNGRGIILGGITGVPPTQVLILGAGTVAEYAVKSALGLGADVKVFDTDTSRLRRLKHTIGREIYTCVINPSTLSNVLKSTDVVIGAMPPIKGRTPVIVSDEMVSKMKSDAVIIDVSIDQGGCFETSKITNHLFPTYKVHDVIHYCVPNISSRVARTASKALSNTLTPLLSQIGEKGGFENMLWEDAGLREGVYTYKGNLTNEYLSGKFSIKYQDMSILMLSKI